MRRSVVLSLVTLLAMLLAVGSAAAWVVVIEPIIMNNNAKEQLTEAQGNIGVIAAVNNELTAYTGGSPVEGTNKEQKALSVDGAAPTTPAAVIFSNGLSASTGGSGDSAEHKQVSIYLDFASQVSRDVVSMNAATLAGMVRSGEIDLHVVAVPTGNPRNLYSFEALAEVANTHPDKAWGFLLEAIRANVALRDDNAAESVLEALDKISSTLGTKGVTKDGIKNGTFASWIVDNSKDEHLLGSVMPVIVINGQRLATDTFSPNNSEELLRAIREAR